MGTRSGWILLGFALACAGTPEAPAPAPAAPAAAGRPRPAAGPPPGGGGPPPGGGAGAPVQSAHGFPAFHGMSAPAGPSITEAGAWSAPIRVSTDEGGGYRPQVAAAPDGTLHAVYYARLPAGDLLRHRWSADGRTWAAPQPFGFDTDRNWGPDIVAEADGGVAVVFDHARPDFTSQGWFTRFTPGGAWSAPAPLTPDNPQGEVGSGHLADVGGGRYAAVWIGKARVGPGEPFRAWARWGAPGAWEEPVPLSDGRSDAWHTNVERRPDGSVLAGWDIGQGGGETTLYVADGRDGRFAAAENLSANGGRPGERPHFAFGADGVDHVAWFHKQAARPVAVYVRSGRPGAWSPRVDEPARGYGGFHFDPDIAIDADGVRVLVWGWDNNTDAELVYSVDRGQGWEPPRRVATLGSGKPGLPSLTVGPDGTFTVVWNQGVAGQSDVYAARWDP